MLTEQQFTDLVTKVGNEAAGTIKKEFATVEKSINDKHAETVKGLMKAEDFEKFKTDEISKLSETLKKVEDAMKEQGTVINTLKETGTPAKPKTLADVLADKETISKIKEVQKNGQGVVEIPLDNIIVKTAGSQSVGNSIQPMTPPPNSPYLPVAAPIDASNFFGIMYNPNFIINYVNRGSTNFYLLPWVNETSVEGAAAQVQEGAAKPLWNTRFKVEMSTAKKIAAMSTITEEFDQDLPGFTTIVQRLLTEEVTRKWDDAVYTAVIAIATAQGYNITGLNGKVDDANLYDALRAGIAQIGKKNFNANFIGINPVTNALVEMQKSTTDRLYLLPPFLQRIMAILREGNKVAEDNALVGDISQYNVDTYKSLVLKVGYNLDDFQRNQFSTVAEVRYHDYISDNRKPALSYYNLETVRALIDSGS
jgi:capsid protein